MKTLCFILAFNIWILTYQENEVLKNIRSKYSEINANLNMYKRIKKDIIDGMGEGGNIVGYLYKDSVKLVIETNYWESGKERTEYYYDKGAPIFVYNLKYHYKRPIYDSAFNSNEYVLEEERYYFNNKKMIKWIDNKKNNIVSTNSKFIQTEKRLLEYTLGLIEDASNNFKE